MVTLPKNLVIGNMAFFLKPLHEAGFLDKDVLYVILTMEDDGNFFIIDVGQSGEYGAPSVNSPDRRACWELYTPLDKVLVGTHRLASDFNMKEDRERIISQLRAEYHPPCMAKA
ncbi:MAG TPA: hypothetical protein VHM90_12790 [Phycisphaerae bacterium]|jgi:hypothetical protein|nr:hypothetical protein [Phycisphaerae bacterium]